MFTTTRQRAAGYDLRYHLPPGDAWHSGSAVPAPGLALVIDGADEIAIDAGWLSPRYGIKVSAVTRGRDAQFRTEVLPR
jgi:hypothetical protein